MFYRYEVRIGSDKPWEGGFQCLFPDQLRHIEYLKEPKWYKNHPDVDTRCWFTQEGFDKYGDLVEEAIKERGVLNYPNGEYRLVKSETLENIVMLGKKSSVYKGGRDMYDLKIPLGMMSEILIVRNRLKGCGKRAYYAKPGRKVSGRVYAPGNSMSFPKGKLRIKTLFLFIEGFLGDHEIIWQTFTAGYCYYFAVMLKDAFQRGRDLLCAPYGHICWVDDNGVPYDISGVCDSECDFYIPVRYIPEGIADFKHIPHKAFNASKEYIETAIQTFCRDVIANIEQKEKNYDLKSKIQIQQTYRQNERVYSH